MMMSVDTLNVPYQPHLRSPSPPASVTRGDPKLSGLTAIDSRSRRHRPGRQVSSATTTGPARSVSSGNDYSIRPMRAGDLLVVADLMKKEGWNVDFDNMAQVYTMQPHNFFVAHTASGEIVGHCSAMSLNDSVGILSYVLVSSEHQKQGLGSRLMGQAKQALGGRTMAFYSVENAVPFYKSRNFDTRRFSILVRDFNLHAQDFAALPHDGTVRVVKAQEVDFDKLNAYHTAVQGMDHADYLAQWILRPTNVSFAALDTATGDIVGYVSLSYFRGRWDVSPLYADSDDVSLQLLKRASQEIAEPIRVFVRIPADSSRSIKLFNKLRDVRHHRVLYLMSDQALPSVSSDKVYSLSTVCYGLK